MYHNMRLSPFSPIHLKPLSNQRSSQIQKRVAAFHLLDGKFPFETI